MAAAVFIRAIARFAPKAKKIAFNEEACPEALM
jgi:hypothetical protein